MLGTLTLRNLRLQPEAPAILFEGRTITHPHLCRTRLAARRRRSGRRGVARGDRVAILAENCPEYLESYAAGELGGWASVTVNYRLAAPEIDTILSDSRTQGDHRRRRVPRPVEPGGVSPPRSCLGYRRCLVRRVVRGGAGGGIARAAAGRAGTGRLRLPDLHQRHHRAAQGRDAEPPRHDGGSAHHRAGEANPTGRPLRALHAALPHRRAG